MRGLPVTYEYLLKRRKTRPRLGKPLLQELTTYSQEISQMAESRKGSLENRIEQSSPTQPDHPFARSPRVIRGAEANAIIERTVERARGVWRDAQKAPHCTACGAPMFVSKAGNSVCADLCWKKNNRWSS